jgi:acid phosphatase (class A)
MKHFLNVVLILSVVLSLAVCGVYAKGNVYITPADIDLTRLLPPPPAQESAETKKEIEELLDFQKNRDHKMQIYAFDDQDINVFRFADTLGKNFTKEKLPVTAKFFEEVVNTDSDIVEPAKDYWKRPRPSEYDSRINPCVTVPPGSQPGTFNPAYPSGHSTADNLMAIILANMVPEKSAKIYNRGWEFAVNRIIGGVHYRSDVEAGRISAAVIAALLFKDKEFMKDYEKSKAEVRNVLGYK